MAVSLRLGILVGRPVVRAALRGLCPACGKGGVFRNLLEFKPACPICGFDLGAHDNGDGPAFFVIIIVGFLVTGAAAWVEFAYTPPLWVHAALWGPLVLIGSLLLLRVFKALILASQYKHRLLENDDGN